MSAAELISQCPDGKKSRRLKASEILKGVRAGNARKPRDQLT